MAYNSYQQMHYSAVYGPKKQPTTPKPELKKKYGLYEGPNLIDEGPYPLLVYMKKELHKNGRRFLKIKPIK